MHLVWTFMHELVFVRERYHDASAVMTLEGPFLFDLIYRVANRKEVQHVI